MPNPIHRYQPAMEAETPSSVERPPSFVSLPYELVFKILNLTYQPQVVVIEFKRHKRPRNKTPVPAALHINHMCRAVAKETYTLLEYNPQKDIDFETWPRIYMNFDTDHIMLSPHPDYPAFAHDRQTRHQYYGYMHGSYPPYKALVRFFSFLKAERRKHISILFQDMNCCSLYQAMSRGIEGVMRKISMHMLLRNSKEIVFIAERRTEMKDITLVQNLVNWYYDHQRAIQECGHEVTELGQLELGNGFVTRWVSNPNKF